MLEDGLTFKKVQEMATKINDPSFEQYYSEALVPLVTTPLK